MATLHSIKAKKDPEISREFFKEYTNSSEVSRKLYEIKSKSKTKTIGTVTRCFKRWNEEGYLDKSRVSRERGTITAYRLNLKPFLKYANKKIRKVREKKELKLRNELDQAKDKELKKGLRDLIELIKEKEFNNKEVKFLEYIFNLPNVRNMVCNRDTLFDGIIGVLEKIFFYKDVSGETLYIEIAKAFFARDKRQFKKIPDSYDQYEEFWRVIIAFLDKLFNKIKDLTGFNLREYRDLASKTEINTYRSIPFAIPRYCSEKEKKNLLRRWEISFYENRSPTNDELLATRGE